MTFFRPAMTRVRRFAMTFTLALAVTVALLAVTGAAASTDTLACGQVITANTTLANDLLECQGDGIVIGAHGITLNLNGHTLSAAVCELDCIDRVGVANTAGYDRVRIMNGTVGGFTTNVSLVGATDNTLANLTVGGFPVFGDFVGVSLSDSYENHLDAINAQGGDPAVRLTSSDRNTISRSTITGGVSIHRGGTLRLVDGSDDNLLADSQLDGEEGTAILDSAGNRLLRNTMSAYTEAIFLGGARETIIANNTLAGGNTPTAISAYAADANVIRGNRMTWGVWILGDGNRIERNEVAGSIRGGAAIEIAAGQANLILSNRTRSGEVGIGVRSGASATQIVGNVVIEALGDGIAVDAPGTVVRKNIANNNGDLGIEAIAGTIDGGGNKAKGNGNPLQCVNVVCR